jgi:hypothetical protein
VEQFSSVDCKSLGPTISRLHFHPPGLRARRDACLLHAIPTLAGHEPGTAACDSAMFQWCGEHRDDPACLCVRRERRVGPLRAAEHPLCGASQTPSVYVPSATRAAVALTPQVPPSLEPSVMSRMRRSLQPYLSTTECSSSSSEELFVAVIVVLMVAGLLTLGWAAAATRKNR